MLATELYDDPASATSDPGLVHVASQIVQLLWLETADAKIPKFGGNARTQLLTMAGALLKRLAEHTKERVATDAEWGALPSPASLETSSYLLEAFRDAGVAAAAVIDDTVVGDQRYADIRGKLERGELPSNSAQQKLMEIFSALADVAARREYKSPLHDAP